MQKLLGLDIDGARLRYGSAELTLRGLKNIRTGDLAIPTERSAQIAALADELRRLKKDFSPAGVVIGLPLHYFSCTALDMPVMARDDMRRALEFELEKHLPLPVDEYEYDFISARTSGGMRVVVLSLRRELVSAVIGAVRDAEMVPVSLRCRTVDLIGSFSEVVGSKDFNGVFINSAASSFEIAGLLNGRVQMLKSAVKASDVESEIERTLVTCPGKVFVSGDIQVRANTSISVQNMQLSSVHAVLSSFAKKRQFGMEFLPAEYAPKKRDLYPAAIAGCAAVAVVFLLLTGFVTYLKDVTTLRSIERRLDTIKKEASGVIEARRKLESLQDDRKIIEDFLLRSNRAVRALNDLSVAVPKDAWLINLSLDDRGAVEMEGFADKTSDLVLGLEKSGRFTSIVFAAPIISREGQERFSLKMEDKTP